MFRNHLKIALRSFLKHKQNTFINLFGLILGLSCCIVLFHIVQYELGYDRFHARADRIYRINLHLVTPDRTVFTNGSSYGLPQVLGNEFPDLLMDQDSQLQATVFRYLEFGQVDVLNADEKETSYREEWIAFAQPGFFHVFDVEWLAGDPGRALEAPNQVVLSRAVARKYFGDLADSPDQILGKSLRLIDEGGIQPAASEMHCRSAAL